MKRRDPLTRLAAKSTYVDRGFTSLCCVTNAVGNDGYGQIGIRSEDGKYHTKRAHRVAYEILVGPIPEGLELDHLCRQPDCHEITHLEAVTASVNQRRGRAPDSARARAAALTHCKHGHEFTPENTRPRLRNGYRLRDCLECKRRRQREHTRKRYATDPEFRARSIERSRRQSAAKRAVVALPPHAEITE